MLHKLTGISLLSILKVLVYLYEFVACTESRPDCMLRILYARLIARKFSCMLGSMLKFVFFPRGLK